MDRPHLQYFTPSEYREWWDDMCPRILVLMDVLRHKLGSRIDISAHPKSLGRKLGRSSQSSHNIDYWGRVMAVDFFVEHIYYREQSLHVTKTMTDVGFTGIGVYTGWTNNKGKLQVGFHGDARPNRSMGGPATWGRIDGTKSSMINAIQHLPLAPA